MRELSISCKPLIGHLGKQMCLLAPGLSWQRLAIFNNVAPTGWQLHGDTALHTWGQCDLLRTFRARGCDSVHLVLAPDLEIRPTRPTLQQPLLHRRRDIKGKNLQ